MTVFYDLEDRLVATNDARDRAAVYDPAAPNDGWRSANALAGKAPVDGKQLSEVQAKASYPNADFDAVPAL